MLSRRRLLAATASSLILPKKSFAFSHGGSTLASFVGVVPASYSMLWNNNFDPAAIEYFDNTGKLAWNNTLPAFPLDWNNNTVCSTVTLNTVLAPDGSTTGSSWTESSTNSLHMLRAIQVQATQDGSPTRCAVIAKANSRTRIVAQLGVVTNNLSTEHDASVGFDLAGGNTGYDVVAGTGWTITNQAMRKLPNGWWLCTFDANSTNGYPFWYLTVFLDSGSGTAARSTTYQGDGSSGVYIWWANMLPTAMWSLIRQTFHDDFTTSATIDLSNTQAAGFNWYIANAWASCGMTGFSFRGNPPTVAGSLSVANSVLTWNDVTNTVTNYIYTAAPQVGDTTKYVGQVFAAPALFEARMTWGSDPATADTWPAFWADAIEGLTGASAFQELDFMEHFAQNMSDNTTWAQHIFQTPTTTNNTNGGSARVLGNVPGFSLQDMHRYATLWLAAAANNGAGLLMQFFDGIYVSTASGTWGISDLAATGDTQHMAIILAGGNTGGSPGWPTYIDWVRAYGL